MKNRRVLFLNLLFIFLFNGFVFAEAAPISIGAHFPDVTFRDRLSGEEQSYLGLTRKPGFSLKDMSGSFFIIEVFSTYCMSCPKDVPILNAVYSSIGNDPALRGKVKVIGIAVGNTGSEVAAFRKEYKMSYPVLTDLRFTLHKTLGNPRVPYTILIKRNSRGNLVVDTHQGVLDSPEAVLKKVMDFLSR